MATEQKIEEDIVSMVGDKRPTFRQLLERYGLTLTDVALKAGTDLLQAERLYQLLPVYVGDADRLLQALSEIVGQPYTRVEVGKIYFRTDYK